MPPPPPVSGSAPPPPPPPGLTAPPGYVGYSTGPIGSVALKRVSGISKAVIALVASAGILGLLEPVVRRTVRDEAQQYLDGGVSDTRFMEQITGYLLYSVLISIATVTGAVLTIIWAYRVTSNHRALHRGTTWGPGWAIGGWFTPPLLYVIPTLMLREMWRASDPSVPVGGEWRSRPGSPLPYAWFVLYSLVPTVIALANLETLVGSFGGTAEDTADQLTGSSGLAVASGVLAVSGAAVFVVLVQRLTTRHCRLTGESARGR